MKGRPDLAPSSRLGRLSGIFALLVLGWVVVAFVLVPTLIRVAHGTTIPLLTELMAGRESTAVEGYLASWAGYRHAITVALGLLTLAALPAGLVLPGQAERARHLAPASGGPLDRPGLVLTASIALLCGVLVLLASVDPVAYVIAVTEDSWVEHGTFAVFVIAALVFLQAGLRVRGWQRLGPFTFATAALFVGLEEISWGQRIFGFEVPGVLKPYNAQGEVTLHNVWFPKHAALGVGLLLFATGLPILQRWLPIRDWTARIGIPTPPPFIRPVLGVAAVLLLLPTAWNPPYLKVDEMAELALGIGILVLSVYVATAAGIGSARAKEVVLPLVAASIVSAGFVTAGMVRWASSEDSLVWRLNDFAVSKYPAAGMPEQAVVLFDYLETHPERRMPTTRPAFGRLLLSLGRQDRGERVLRRALDDLESAGGADGDDADRLRHRAEVHDLLGEAEAAHVLYGRSLALAEAELRAARTAADSGRAHGSAARTLGAMGRSDEAFRRTALVCEQADAQYRYQTLLWAKLQGYPVDELSDCLGP